MGYKSSKYSKLELEKRRNKAVSLLAAGYTYQKIADQLGYYNRASAYNDIKKALHLHQASDVEHLRSLELERLDVATKAIFNRVIKGDDKAIDTLLKIMTRRARYVPQLEVPQEHEVAAGSGSVTVMFHPGLGAKTAPAPTPQEVTSGPSSRDR